MCSFYHVPYYEYGTKEELGHAMGKKSCIPGGNRRRVWQKQTGIWKRKMKETEEMNGKKKGA